MPTTVSTHKPAIRKPLIVSTTPLNEGSKCYGSFTFSDGVTVRINGGLVCSQHGRRHCTHHKAAHDAIIAKVASYEVATEAAMEAAEAFDADYDAWLDSLPPSYPTPAGVGEVDDRLYTADDYADIVYYAGVAL
jgi:hypothetical protein